MRAASASTTNLAESYKWFALAAAQGDNEAAKKRDEVAARLDAAGAGRGPAARSQTFVARARSPTSAISRAGAGRRLGQRRGARPRRKPPRAGRCNLGQR